MTTKLGHLEIEGKIGAGGMGDVFRARDTRLGRRVAVKLLPDRALLNPEAHAQFLREARAASALNHPNICTIHDIGEHEGRHFIVMELLDGETLQTKIGGGPLPTEEFFAIARQIVDGLDAAHTSGIIHRDIKPGNILITSLGVTKILDFGLAKTESIAADPSPEDATMALEEAKLTTPGVAMGTIAYMSPEQALGEEVDARSDIFSLGVVLYEMASGRQPFPGRTDAATFDAILNRPPVPLVDTDAELPDDVAHIIGRALEKKREQRYASVAELRADLDAAEAGRTPATAAAIEPEPNEPPSIAVLPFVNMSADPENEYFTDGMAEEIITSLCKIEALRVASRTSSFAFKDKREDVRQIGRALNVGTILEGSVRKAGARLRISAQLVKVDDGYQLWSERFDRDLDDVFAVQDEIAESITGALSVVLSPREKEAIHRIPTQNMEAYDLYLRGRYCVNSVGDETLRHAERFFRRAVELDPNFALAWVGVAEAATWLYDWFTPTANLQEIAESASQKALAIDANLAEAHVARGFAGTIRRDIDLARREFDIAARLDPQLYDAFYYHGRVCMLAGQMEDAAPLLRKAARIRVEDYQAVSLLQSVLKGLNRHDEARVAAREAVSRIEKHLELHPDDVRAVYFGAGSWAALGDHDKAVEWGIRALTMRPEDSGVRYNVACVYAGEGMIEDAIQLIEKNVDADWGNYDWIRNDPDLDPLRDHPRFEGLLTKLAARGDDGGQGGSA